MATFPELFSADPWGTLGLFVLLLVLTVGVTLPFVAGALYAVFFLLTLPMRRNERARLFLDLLELGINDGHTPERAIVNAARSRDRMLGGPFHRLAAHLEHGLKLGNALELVPRMIPPAAAAMLRAGEKLGDVRLVLPACRQLLRDGVSQVRGALNYLIVIGFCVTPFMIAIPVMLRVKVLPQYRAVFAGMGVGDELPAFTRLVFDYSSWFTLGSTALLGCVWFALACYLAGPWLTRFLDELLPGLGDTLVFRLPWRRKRLQRNFSAMLAVLLDSGMPEAEAVRLAAEATANRVMLRRAARVRQRLADGARLADALKAIDDAGELHWRLANARPALGGFRRALAGWHEALDAKAFQQEQAAAQFATTTMVLFNGAIVASFVLAIFLVLIDLVNQATLW